MTTYVVYNPTAARSDASRELAPRPESLDGTTIGLLFNSKPNADVLLERVRERLGAMHDATFVLRSKPTAARPMAREVIDAMRGCDAVVNAIGD